ncbi:hypothetical protein [Novosphingobium sp. FKTRR1]|uniref:hypothetical protein n=1 Tax=unclassified Novosphingobium TaxID=2644732 RepID=UPI001CF0ACA5|nr:hypothetical protein [Novosphingobium sp. FKTRR1]
MLSIRSEMASQRRIAPRHHYLLVYHACEDTFSKQVELFADTVDDAITFAGKAPAYREIEVWEDGLLRTRIAS